MILIFRPFSLENKTTGLLVGKEYKKLKIVHSKLLIEGGWGHTLDMKEEVQLIKIQNPNPGLCEFVFLQVVI